MRFTSSTYLALVAMFLGVGTLVTAAPTPCTDVSIVQSNCTYSQQLRIMQRMRDAVLRGELDKDTCSTYFRKGSKVIAYDTDTLNHIQL